MRGRTLGEPALATSGGAQDTATHLTAAGPSGQERAAQSAPAEASVTPSAATATVGTTGAVSKRMRRVLANRASAARSKDRLRAIEELQQQVTMLEQHGANQTAELQRLQVTNDTLRRQSAVLEHMLMQLREELRLANVRLQAVTQLPVNITQQQTQRLPLPASPQQLPPLPAAPRAQRHRREYAATSNPSWVEEPAASQLPSTSRAVWRADGSEHQRRQDAVLPPPGTGQFLSRDWAQMTTPSDVQPSQAVRSWSGLDSAHNTEAAAAGGSALLRAVTTGTLGRPAGLLDRQHAYPVQALSYSATEGQPHANAQIPFEPHLRMQSAPALLQQPSGTNDTYYPISLRCDHQAVGPHVRMQLAAGAAASKLDPLGVYGSGGREPLPLEPASQGPTTALDSLQPEPFFDFEPGDWHQNDEDYGGLLGSRMLQ